MRASAGEAGKRHYPVSANACPTDYGWVRKGGWPDKLLPDRRKEVGQVSEAHGQQGKKQKLIGQVNPRRGQLIERSSEGSGWAQMRRWQGAGARRELTNSRGFGQIRCSLERNL